MNSYRQILRASSIIAGSSVINVLIGLVRTKVAAVLLGPAGIGLIGLMQSLMATASTVSALGFGTVGTRQIAEAAGRGDQTTVAIARRALLWGCLGLALIGGCAFWLLRGQLAERILRDPGASTQLGWLAVGVALTVAATSQTALLNGLRRIGDLARLSIASALLLTLLGLPALYWLGETGLLLFVLAAPISNFVVGHWFVRRLGPADTPNTPNTTLPQLGQQWRAMARIGAAFMVSGVAVTLGQLAVRSLIQEDQGPEALGHFHAAWAISVTYIAFVLGAMGTDYLPRLAAVLADREQARRLVNEQTEIALLLAGPVLIGMLALAPWVIELLYSSAFHGAATILRWQILGDLLKVASWPLGFIILAAGDGKTFMWTESLGMAMFVLFTWIGLPLLGVEASGVAFLLAYVIYGPVVYWLAWRRIGFSWTRHIAALFFLFLTASGIVAGLAMWSNRAAIIVGVLLSAILMVYGLVRISLLAKLGGRAGRIGLSVRGLMFRLGFIRE